MAEVRTVKMVGGKKGTLVVNEDEVAKFQKQGYKIADQEPAGTGDGGVDFNTYTVAELKGFAEEAGVADFETMKKAELIQALTDAEFEPVT